MCNNMTCGCGKGGSMHLITKILLIVGGINWGLVGLGMLMGGANWNVVYMIFGSMPMVEAIIYVLVGVAAVIKIFRKKCACCSMSTGGTA